MNKKRSVLESEPLPEYSMRMVALQTGLSPDVIRVWEKRYNAVTPRRTATGRRVYSGEEVERLKLLRTVTLQGHAISGVAGLSAAQLRELAGHKSRSREHESEPVDFDADSSPGGESFFAHSYVEQSLDAVRQLDAARLENVLARSAMHLGPTATMESVLEPLMTRIDHLWESGALRIAEEHVASAVLQTFLSSLMRHAPVAPNAPVLAVTTPSRQLHELGALMVAATAAYQGWKVAYLGPNLPAFEIAPAAQRCGAQVVALSIVYPADDTGLAGELKELRRQLPEIALLVGGRAAGGYNAVLKQIRALRLENLSALRTELAALWPLPAQTPRMEK